MTHSHTNLHVYRREIRDEERTSLSVLASFVSHGATVLDLGTGSGALGRYLHEQAQCTVDGLTINDAEAEVARPHYRRLEVANLENCILPEIFAGARYDFIICADVLEHLSRPERIVEACRDLLAPDGKLLISVPNAAYSGLIGELLLGEFTYREEGLLDNTHLRFFTRKSLSRFLHELGWSLDALETIRRELPSSEFKVAFDSLPPAVSRYLLAIPDALTYQFIAVAQPGVGSNSVWHPADTSDAQALFSVQLYPGVDGQYDEDAKLTATGVIGQDRQSLRFDLPAQRLSHLRLDPADRPGFLHLYQLTLRGAEGAPQWQWRSDSDGVAPLETRPQQQIALRPLWPASSASLILLHGDDPWLELPIPQDILQSNTQNTGCTLEVELGWPMSADYLAAATLVHPLSTQISDLKSNLVAERNAYEQVNAGLIASNTKLAVLADQNKLLFEQEVAHKDSELQSLTEYTERLHAANNALVEEKKALQNDLGRLATHLQWIENSTIFRATRPLVKFKMWITGKNKTPEPIADAPLIPPSDNGHPIDIIVPVYRGLEDTRCCIESVLSHAPACKTPFRLVVINDASPEPEVTAWLRNKAAQEPSMLLLENPENLGFVATVNRGMALSNSSDVILLNSDAEVANDWLDRMVRAAWSAPKIASVTPFSNNATICSYPRFCADNTLPEGYDTAQLDALFAQSNSGKVVDVPTGVGFCMYIRRDCLADVGLFDVKNFGKGYGEENDFCQRAAKAGWRNLHLLDTFVRHAGGVSFGDSKSPREQEAMVTLRRLHPDYERAVHQFVADDPARSARQMVDLARLRESDTPVILAIMHDRAGGTLRHATELVDHLQSRAAFFTLTPSTGGKVILQQLGDDNTWQLSFHIEAEFEELILALRHIGVRHLHYHHLIGHSQRVLELPARLGVLYDFTAHDFYTMCPQISLTDSTNSYCGERGIEQCNSCLRLSPAPGGVDIETWRSTYSRFLAGARYVLAPSHDTVRRMARFTPSAHVRYVPHTDIHPTTPLPAHPPRKLSGQTPLRVVVIGALSSIKGADILEDVAAKAAKNGIPLEFHLIGFAYRSLRSEPATALTIHGQYAESDLPDLLASIQPDLAWFPAQWPETYSYTLSACLQAGLPIVAPDLGAFPERLQGRAWTWIHPWNTLATEWNQFFLELRQKHFVTGQPPHSAVLATEAAPVEDQDWAYEQDYLNGLAPIALVPTPLIANFLDRQNLSSTETSTWGEHTKQQALLTLVRLRSAPGLRSMARAIPLRWQTRVKSWLRA